MSLKFPNPLPYSCFGFAPLASSLDVETDSVFGQLTDDLEAHFAKFGPVVSPAQNLKAALTFLKDGGVLMLMPGTYMLYESLEIGAFQKLVGFGDVTIEFAAGAQLLLQGERSSAEGLTLLKRDVDRLAGWLVELNGDRSRLHNCILNNKETRAVAVNGDGCAVTANVMRRDAAFSIIAIDTYVSDSASSATICGNQPSLSRYWSVSYKTGTSTVEAANSVHVQVRP